jgi:hypothetical protein
MSWYSTVKEWSLSHANLDREPGLVIPEITHDEKNEGTSDITIKTNTHIYGE